MANTNTPTGSSHLSFTLAALSAAGGLAGYLKTGSAPSLIAGLGIGGIYLCGGWLINVGFCSLNGARRSSPCVIGEENPLRQANAV